MCKNDNVMGSVNCFCGVGFIGVYCEVDIDECVLNFCMFNVYCMD